MLNHHAVELTLFRLRTFTGWPFELELNISLCRNVHRNNSGARVLGAIVRFGNW